MGYVCPVKLVLKTGFKKDLESYPMRARLARPASSAPSLRVGGAPHMNAGPDSDMSWILCGARPIKRRARSESGLIAPNIAGQSARTLNKLGFN